MSSREKILAAVKKSQPDAMSLPDLKAITPIAFDDAFVQYCTTLKNIGGQVVEVKNTEEVSAYIQHTFNGGQNCVTTLPELNGIALLDENSDAHNLQNTELAIINAQFAVAENGTVWITEEQYKMRALPFICNHLAVIIDKNNIVNTMHQAYDLIQNADYGFGVFIAGPSKTADIEQSLVLGAHGPKTMTVFVLKK
jgi:L-lactate dehydrogenase complex protein LldG